MAVDKASQAIMNSQDWLSFAMPDAVSLRSFPRMVVRANLLRRYYESNPDSNSQDNSTATSILINLHSGEEVFVLGAVDTTQARLGTWNFTEHLIPGGLSIVRTASPSAYNWIGLETENNPSRLVDWLTTTLRRISEFPKLEPNWDGYQARKPDKLTCQRGVNAALRIAEASSMADPPPSEPPFITPLSSGGVLFEIRNGNRELHLSFEPDQKGTVEVLKVSVTPAQDEVEEELRVDESKLGEVLSWIYKLT